ncbi:unnamed protein product [Thlaspi arvense]|uniref:Uncharacterized protein n=1 Tax=Thlaspi arvense TaxID=13288 RepID=A0AAU9SSH8_THLAR|nr:unnamed protein product [Thlaspi arvense]
MKQCDRGLSPLAPPFAIGSSSLSFSASESDPEDSFWRDFTFDFSFLTSDDQKTGLDDDADSLSNPRRHADASTVPKAGESKLYGLAANARPVKDLGIRRSEDSDSFLKLPNFLESGLKRVDSKPRISTADSNVTMVEGRSQHFPPTALVLGVTSITPMANDSVANDDGTGNIRAEGRFRCAKDKEACVGKVLVSKDTNESKFSPLFSKMSAAQCSSGSGIDKLDLCSGNRTTVLSEKSSITSDQDDDIEVDSPCWRGTRSRIKSLSFRRSTDDLNVLYGLNPLAPQFIPSNAKKKLDKKVKESEDNASPSLKRSLSSTFPPSSGEFSATDPYEAGIEQDSNRIGILFQDADESLGLVSQDSASKTMSNQFQMPKKLDPLAPVFVPANAKLSAIVYEKPGVADHMIATEKNAHSAYAPSSSDDMLLNCVKAETNSPEVGHSFRNPYSNNVRESGNTYSFNPRLSSQVQISENTRVDSSSNRTHGSKKLNPLAPQFSVADTKPQVYGSDKHQAANHLPPMVNSSVLLSPNGYSNHKAQSSVHLEPSSIEVGTKQMGFHRHRPNILHGSSSPQMDVKKLLTTIHGLSESLTHVHGSETLDEQDLDLINCTVQNLNSYINNSVQATTGNYSSAVHSSCGFRPLPNMPKQSIRDHQIPKARSMSVNADVRRKEKYSMVSGEIGADSQFENSGFGQVVRNHHQIEEQINPQVYFYRSLWLKAKADRLNFKRLKQSESLSWRKFC